MTDDLPEPRDGATRWAALSFLAYAVLHHLGTGLGGLGGVGDSHTRWADWIDLAVPFLVLGPAVLALVAARPGRRAWSGFVVGAVLYVEGHGIHLAANSIGNVAPGPVAHLWDEIVGHLVWYAGWFVVAGSLAVALGRRPLPTGRRASVAAGLLAAGVGVTVATNTLGGGSPVLAAIACLAALVYGLRHRRRLAGLLIVAVGAAFVTMAVSLWSPVWGSRHPGGGGTSLLSASNV